jgi:hypothetical protein
LGAGEQIRLQRIEVLQKLGTLLAIGN